MKPEVCVMKNAAIDIAQKLWTSSIKWLQIDSWIYEYQFYNHFYKLERFERLSIVGKVELEIDKLIRIFQGVTKAVHVFLTWKHGI